MIISQLSADLILCHKHCELRGFKKSTEWLCGLMVSISDRSSLKPSQKFLTDFSINYQFNNRAYKRAKTLFYLGQYKRAAFYLAEHKQHSTEHRCLYYLSHYMAIESDRCNMGAEGESTPNIVKQIQQKISDVLVDLEKDLKKHNDSWLLTVYSQFLLKLNRIEQARDTLLLSLQLEPLNWSSWDLLSALITDKDHLKSVNIPQNWQRWFFYAKVYMRLQMFEEAYDLYLNKISKVFPTSTFVISQLAIAQNELRDIEAAVDNFHRVRRIDPFRLDYIDVYSNALYVSQRRYELASLAHTANEIEPFRYETCFSLANFYSLRAQHDKAATYFQRALKLDPTNVCAWILQGHEYMEMKKTEDAIKAYRKAINLDRYDERAWYGLGQLYEILKLPNISLDSYLEAHKLKPQDSRILNALADTYEKLEWYDQAANYHKRAAGAELDLDSMYSNE